MPSGRSPADLHTFKAEFFRALAHPTRIRILELLSLGDRSVQELQRALALDQPIISQQLSLLRTRQIVRARKLGTTIRYALRDPLITEMLATARAMFDNHLVGTQEMLRQLREEQHT